MKGEPMTIFGDGTQTRAFSYIDDVAPYIAESVMIKKARNEIFNIGADTVYSVNELAQCIARVLSTQPSIKYMPARKEVAHAFSDHSKIKKVFKIKKNTDLEIGIHKMVTWAKKNGYVKSKRFKNIEIDKNIPLLWQKIV